MSFVKDRDCTKETPVIYGKEDPAVYGKGVSVEPGIPEKRETKYDQTIYLPELLPLEKYDLIVVLFSGGKDSMACYWKLRELGVPNSKMELWHHDVDGGNPTRKMDWPVTQAYNRAFAEAAGVPYRASWRVNGFFGELYRISASQPVAYEDGSEVRTCRLSKTQLESEALRERMLAGETLEDQFRCYGYRMKFPAKSGDLARRWCSAYLKIEVAGTVIRNMERLKENVKLLLVSGERRGESTGRAKYNEMERHRTNATAKANRLVHQ